MLKPGLNDEALGVGPNREVVFGVGANREVLGVGENREVLGVEENREALRAGVDAGKPLEKSEFPGVVDIVAVGLDGPAIGLKPLNVVI